MFSHAAPHVPADFTRPILDHRPATNRTSSQPPPPGQSLRAERGFLKGSRCNGKPETTRGVPGTVTLKRPDHVTAEQASRMCLVAKAPPTVWTRKESPLGTRPGDGHGRDQCRTAPRCAFSSWRQRSPALCLRHLPSRRSCWPPRSAATFPSWESNRPASSNSSMRPRRVSSSFPRKPANSHLSARPWRPSPTGLRMPEISGWFKTEISTPEDLEGLKMRICGLGGDVMRVLDVEVPPRFNDGLAYALRTTVSSPSASAARNSGRPRR